MRECYELGLNRETIRQVAEEVGGEALEWEGRERAHYGAAELGRSRASAKT